MTQSAEYPDLKWMPPKSWTNTNRTSVQVVIIHDTEGSENASSAEDGASYDQRRTDGTSTHYFHDQNSTVQCVLTADQAHAARTQGNRRGIQHELCGRASQGAAGWADAASAGTLRQAAKQVARDCKKWNIPVRKLTASQVAAGSKGICGHADITAAFPADNGTHTDPGPTFPWSTFIDMVDAIVNPTQEVPVATPTWSSQTVLDVNFLLKEASRATSGQAGGTSSEDINARNVRNYLFNVVRGALGLELDGNPDLPDVINTAVTGSIELKLDTIDENTAGLVQDPADPAPSTQQQNLKAALGL